MQSLHALFVAFLLSWFPAQSRDAARFAVEASSNVCLGLTEPQCCEQRLDYAGFKAHGERLPESAQKTLRLSCTQPDRVVPPGACKIIATARGIASPQVDSMCSPHAIQTGCQKDGRCRQCMSDLARLSYRESQNACHAVTFAPEVAKRRVVVVHSAIVVGRDGYRVDRQDYEVR